MNNRLGVLSTAANPLHIGHLNMLHWYEDNISDKVVIEISAFNADKGQVDPDDLDNRCRQLLSINRPYCVSYEPTFIEKIKNKAFYQSFYDKIYNYTCHNCYNIGIDFLVGYDTYQRILDLKYYFGSEKERNRCFDFFLKNNVKFYVFPRIILGVPTRIDYTNELFVEVEKFHPVDISSTQIRNQK